MYSSFPTQIYAWTHYIVAFGLIFIVSPVFMFRRVRGNIADQLIANYVRMVFYIICLGYVLVASHLFEFIGIFVSTLVYLSLKNMRERRSGLPSTVYIGALLFDVLEFPRRGPARLLQFVRSLPGALHLVIIRIQTQWSVHTRSGSSVIRLTRLMMVVLIIGTACAIRLYDAVFVAVPEQSDGDVTLAWMKYINERVLFHDGIYPQGFYLYMAILSKFAVVNDLFILKFTGPIDTSLTVILLYYTIWKLGKSHVGAIISSAIYGVFGWQFLSYDWTRLAASNSQEFGFLFIFPVVYFLHRYFIHGNRLDIQIAFYSICVSGLIHSLSYELGVLAAFSVLSAAAITDFQGYRKQMGWALVAGVASGIITVLPVGLGFLLGKSLNSSATAYMVSTTSTRSMPTLQLFDIIAIVSILLLLIYSFFQQLRLRPNLGSMAVGIWGVICFSIYEFGAAVTHSTVLSSRMLDLWAITAAVVIGVGANVVFELLSRFRYRNLIEFVGWISLTVTLFFLAPPKPILPYTVQWNDDINAFLKINHQFEFKDGGYMIVAPNFEYGLVLGYGYRMDPHQFLTMYDPSKPPLTRYGQVHSDHQIAKYVFLYVYKRIFEVSKSNSVYPLEEPLYKTEKLNQVLYQQWLHRFQKENGPNSAIVYYNSSNLEVFEIEVK